MKKVLVFMLCALLAFAAFPASAGAAGTWDGLSERTVTPYSAELTVEEKAALINTAKLTPVKTNYEPLDTLAAQILGKITTPSMTVYEKVREVFSYLMQDAEYVIGNEITEQLYYTIFRDVRYISVTDGYTVCQAYGFLKEHRGDCCHYSSAFMVLTRALGLESYVITCCNSHPTGGSGDHFAATIRLNGDFYLFDPVMGVVFENTSRVENSGYFCTPMRSEPTREYANLDETIAAYQGFSVQDDISPVSWETLEGAAQGNQHVAFGSYPQSRVTDPKEIAALDKLLTKTQMRSFGYYTGSGKPGSQTSSDYMRYADVTWQGDRYRAVTFDTWRPFYPYYPSEEVYSYQDEAGYTPGNVYWFKYEPLEWRVVDGGTMLICDTVIDAQSFNPGVSNAAYPVMRDGNVFMSFSDKTLSASANDWSGSWIRAWLNGTFRDVAFSAEEQALLISSLNKNLGTYKSYSYQDTEDQIFLLSRNEFLNPNYCFRNQNLPSSAKVFATDYARVMGVSIKTRGGSLPYACWLLRSPGHQSGEICTVSNSGGVSVNIPAGAGMFGLRPVLRVSSLEALSPQKLSAPESLSVRATDTGTFALRSTVINGAEDYTFTVLDAVTDKEVAVYHSPSPEFTVSGLTPGSTYRFRVSASRASAAGVEKTADYTSEPVRAVTFVTAPKDISAEGISTGTIRVSWNSVPGAAAYRVYRYIDTETLELCGEAEGINTLDVSGLPAGCNYWFRVSSVSADGYESAISTASGIGFCISDPPSPTGIIAENPADRTVTLRWNPVEGAASYNVYRYVNETRLRLVGSTDGECEYTETNLYPGISYVFRVTAISAKTGNESYFSKCAGVFCESSLPAPEDAGGTSTDPGAVTLTWDAVPGAARYHIYRYINETDFIEVGVSETNSFTEKGRAGGRTYTYFITAEMQDGTGESSRSAFIRVEAKALDAPEEVTAEAGAPGCVTLTWQPVDEADQYRIVRYLNATDSVTVGVTDQTTFTESGLNTERNHIYRVYAMIAGTICETSSINIVAQPGRLNEAPAETSAQVAGSGAIRVSWSEVKNAGHYQVLMWDNEAGEYKVVGDTEELSYVVTDIAPGTYCTFRVRAAADSGGATNLSPYSPQGVCVAKGGPVAPEGVPIVSFSGQNAELQWNAVPGAAGYVVEAASADGAFSTVADVDGTTAVVEGLEPGATVAFRVRAYTMYQDTDVRLLGTPGEAASVTAPKAEKPAEFNPGDVDDNGKIEVTDARNALRAAVGLENYTPDSRAFLAADTDGNGEIEVSDARNILRAAVGLDQPEDWAKR